MLIKLSFKNGNIYATLQGTEGFVGAIRTFEQIVGMPIANFLMIELEKQASELGYKKIYFINPEFYSNNQIHVNSRLSARGKTLFGQDLGQMNIKIDQKRQIEFQKARNLIKSDMLKLYNNVANVLGYTVEGKWFVKKLEK